VKDIRDAREEAEYELNCDTFCQCPFCVVIVQEEGDSSEQNSDVEDDENFEE
jgi:ferredoxin